MSEKSNKGFARVAIGALAGFINGLFGSGGGSIVVPGVQKFLDIETHEAHASSIAIILPMSVVSAVIYASHTKPDLWILLAVSVGGAVGGFLGAKLLNKLSSKALHKIFGLFIIAAAVRMIL